MCIGDDTNACLLDPMHTRVYVIICTHGRTTKTEMYFLATADTLTLFCPNSDDAAGYALAW